MFLRQSITTFRCALFFLMSLFSLQLLATEEVQKHWITIGSDATEQANRVKAMLAPSLQNKSLQDTPVLIYQVDDNQIIHLSELMHHDHQRCGGFIVHESYQEALASLKGPVETFAFDPPPIQHQQKVNGLLGQIQASSIRSVISSLAQFTNRFYSTTTGKQSAEWLANHWRQLSTNVSWASVEQVNHSSWGQDSVILKITGSQFPNEIIVMGGHLDSTAGSGTREGTVAPGADDDASGIASLTNVAKVLLANGEQPQRSIHIMGYAAEEVGLRGSKEIAASYKSRGEKVVAALQLDMTNYQGSAEDIVFMTDYVNANFNAYMKRLLDTYQPNINYGDDRCGYACSDHASWYNQGYPTSMPFEARFNGANPNIHTRNDTLSRSDVEAKNSVPFAKLALSFAIEMSNPNASTNNQPPVSRFNYSCNDLVCSFDGSGSSDPDGNIQSYQWAFGDGASSSSKQTQHTFNREGVYDVSLLVTDNKGATNRSLQQVSVSQSGGGNPTARIEVNCSALNCEFDGSKSSDDNQISGYQWDFGDGSTSSQMATSHRYSVSGSYLVKLTVTDNVGLTHTASQSLVVKDGNSGGCNGLSQWQATVSYVVGDKVAHNGKQYEAIWWSTGADPSVYSQVWRFIADCDDGGTPTAPIAKFNFQVNKLSVTFTNQSSDDVAIVTHQWQFGDGQSSNAQNPSHSYSKAGSYSVVLKVTDSEGLSDSQTQMVQVSDGDDNGQCTAPAWNASTVYLNGDKVSHEGNEYKANWWSQGDNPSTNSGPWSVWTNLGACQ